MLQRLYPQNRCINIDWFEVDCWELSKRPMNANYFIESGYNVEQRDYGTRVYAEMFTILDPHGHPFVEVRRAPKTPLLPHFDCHLRLHNSACYSNTAATDLLTFMQRHNYQFVRVVRADICLDFEYFDSRDLPAKFVERYMQGTYSKINQANLSGHGTDRWEGRNWNSLSWGSPTSQIGTKLYNKTLELYCPADGSFKKPYIRQAWLECGLIDDFFKTTRTKHTVVDGTPVDKVYRPDIWRLEFSIRSSVKNWFTIEKNGHERDYHSIRNTIECYNSRAKLLTIFASLCQHYFRFKYYEPEVRKDRCRDKNLFDFRSEQTIYKLSQPVCSEKKAPHAITSVISKLRYLQERKTANAEFRQACHIIISILTDDAIMHETNTIFSKEEMQALKYAVEWRQKGDKRPLRVLLSEVKQLLSLHDSVF